MDAGTAALLGTLAGAGITGVITLGVAITNNVFQRGEAKARRDHERDESEASRRYERRTAILTYRQQQIERWRQGLEASHAEYKKWFYDFANDQLPHEPKDLDLEIPSIVGTEWFESLRPYLSKNAETTTYRDDVRLNCDPEFVVVLTHEIARIEERWLDEAQR